MTTLYHNIFKNQTKFILGERNEKKEKNIY